MNYGSLRSLVAEFIATMLFVFLGAGSVVANAASNNALGAVGTAAAHGVGIAVLISMTMNISGGHLNPAVSLSLWLARKIDGATLARYVPAQILGAVAGAWLVKICFPAGAARVTLLGTPQISSTLGLFEAIGVEALLTFFLVGAVFGTLVSSQAPRLAGFGVGLAIFVCVLVGGALTGAAMNPARAIGPAIVAWTWHGQAVYWIGPALGAAAAAALWKFVLLPRDATELA